MNWHNTGIVPLHAGERLEMHLESNSCIHHYAIADSYHVIRMI